MRAGECLLFDVRMKSILVLQGEEFPVLTGSEYVERNEKHVEKRARGPHLRGSEDHLTGLESC